jgi:hypothetical protein
MFFILKNYFVFYNTQNSPSLHYSVYSFYCNNESIVALKEAVGYAHGSLSHFPVLLFIRTFQGVQVIPKLCHSDISS